MASNATTEPTRDEAKPARVRSPNHPALSLQDAIEKVKVIHAKYGRAPVAVSLACGNWGYSNPKSSGLLQTLAATKSYGLVDVSGMGDAQKLSVTEAADHIIRGGPDRTELLKKAALAPLIHKEVWDRFNGLPHDDLVKQYLLWERTEGSRFSDDAVDGFIQRLRATLRYAGFISDGSGSADENKTALLDTPKNGSGPETSRREVQVGSFVQWTSKGVDQFPQPRKVLGVDGDWAFVEGNPTGVPMSELAVVDPPRSAEPATPPTNPFHARGLTGAPPSQSRMSGFPTISLQVGDSQEFPLYTPSGKGTLSVPAQMTKKAFDLLKLQIQNSLCVIEATAIIEDQAE